MRISILILALCISSMAVAAEKPVRWVAEKITTTPVSHGIPCMSYPYVAWSEKDATGNLTQLYVYNIETRETKMVSGNDSVRQSPRSDGKWIVYETKEH